MAFRTTHLGTAFLLAVPFFFLLPLARVLTGLRGAFSVWQESERLLGLATNTVLMTVIAGAVAIPLGVGLALLTTRRRVPGKRGLSALLLLSLLMPLPVLAVTWQVVLSVWIPPVIADPGTVAWRNWDTGLLPAGFVHGVAGLPWVYFLSRAILSRRDRLVEDDARLALGSGGLVRWVLFPRVRMACLASLLLIALQTFSEICISDAMMVRTIAEETYTQFLLGSDGAARIMVWLVPLGLLFILIVLRAVGTKPVVDWDERDPTSAERFRTRLGQGLALASVIGIMALLYGLPLVALAWRAAGAGEAGFLVRLLQNLLQTASLEGRVLGKSVIAALVAAVLTTSFAFLLSTRVQQSTRARPLTLGLMLLLALIPGPVLGIAGKEGIFLLMEWEDGLLNALSLRLDFPPLRSLLYDQPSPLPAIIASFLRFLPVAYLLWLPVFRAIPTDLFALAQLDGLRGWQRWQLLIPNLPQHLTRTVLILLGLALGEVSVTKLVNPPFSDLFILRLFDQMHYGPEQSVATLALLQLGLTALVAVIFFRVGPAEN